MTDSKKGFRFKSSFDCEGAGEHDSRAGQSCSNCGFRNAVKAPKRPAPRPRPKSDGLEDLRSLLRF